MTETQPELPCFTWNINRVIDRLDKQGVAILDECRDSD
jgi:hypothetical protein